MDYQRYFERLLSHKMSDRTFRRYKALLKAHDLPMNKENLSTLAELKKLSDAHKLSLALVLRSFLEMPKMSGSVPGSILKTYILGVTQGRPHRTTLARWLGEYAPEKLYSPTDVTQIVLLAFTYKIRNQNGTHQKPSRASTLSNQKAWSKCG
ncbi:MAG: hypothetical protein ACYTXA_16295 [Nostoc sp.]